MNDAEFDNLLREALLEAVREDWASVLEEAPPPDPEFSARYRRNRARLLADPFGYAKRKRRPVWKSALQTAACFLLAAGIAFSGLMVFSPEARAWVARVITEWRGTHTQYSFTGEPQASSDIGTWRPQYVPDGFTETDAICTERRASVIYEDQSEGFIKLTYAIIDENVSFSNDNEHNDYYSVTIGDIPGDLYVSNKEGKPSYLIWVDEVLGISYQLVSNVDFQELISIAESVQKIN
ncbi:DUF4367 domain-containing protein [Pseudoflavonifractor sp. 524-17]|uniref:DUF4367 domain-containing protein n=1 Tax=Pseudoflavonifractor sp. 524-17 TaxID=2304577 RepID=UPI00137A1193|nr:DUF4367 domain-containing protein [Pseudoflavonifractor sp. 524-17]